MKGPTPTRADPAGPDGAVGQAAGVVPAPASLPTETEIKLSMAPDALETVAAAPPIASRARSRGVVRHLAAVYYDSPDLALSRRGVALRVRKSGRRFVQTLKAATSALNSALSRAEIEWPVEGPGLDIARLGHPAVAPLLEGVDLDALRPVFETQVRRRTLVLDHAGAVIELCLDRGTINAGERSQPVSEIEFELRSGTAGQLFDLALDVARTVPVGIEARSKAMRALDLASGEPVAGVRAPRLGLDPELSVEDAFVLILHAGLGHWLANQAAAVDGQDIEGIHQLRVALRRIRSAIAMIGRIVTSPTLEALDQRLGGLAGSVGDARDWDVFLTELLPPVEAAYPGDASLALLRAGAEREREAAYARARQELQGQPAALLMLEFGRAIESRTWRGDVEGDQLSVLDLPAVEVAARLLSDRQKTALKRGSRFGRLTIEQRHRVRIALKKLRYAADFFRSLFPERRVRDYLGELAALQDELGHLNDVATSVKLTHKLAAPGEEAPLLARGCGLVVGWHARGIVDGEADLVRRWKSFAAIRPFWKKRGK